MIWQELSGGRLQHSKLGDVKQRKDRDSIGRWIDHDAAPRSHHREFRMPDFVDFATRHQRLKRFKGRSFENLAEYFSVHVSFVRQLESCVKSMFARADAIGVSLGWRVD